jgi:hypothetical protein
MYQLNTYNVLYVVFIFLYKYKKLTMVLFCFIDNFKTFQTYITVQSVFLAIFYSWYQVGFIL